MPLNPKTQKKLDDTAIDLCRMLGEHTGERTEENIMACAAVERHALGLVAAMKDLPDTLQDRVSEKLAKLFGVELPAPTVRKKKKASKNKL